MERPLVHLRPHEPVAERVLVPGDPGRALRLAQALLDGPRMLNHHRGLWGYTGAAADGEPLTVQSTGIGGPSAAAVIEELAVLGARRIVRVGTCDALGDELALGDVLAVEAALAGDGTSRALGHSGAVRPDPALLAALRTGARAVTVASRDLFYDADATGRRAGGALASDLTSAAVLAVAAHLGLAAASVVAVTRAGGALIDADALDAAEHAMGRLAAQALGA
jgi:uridine phosphorylase